MKRNYIEPEFKISAFSAEDVITTSGITGTERSASDYGTADGANKSSVAFDDFGFAWD